MLLTRIYLPLNNLNVKYGYFPIAMQNTRWRKYEISLSISRFCSNIQRLKVWVCGCSVSQLDSFGCIATYIRHQPRVQISAANRSIGSTTGFHNHRDGLGPRAFSWLKAPTSTFIFKTLCWTGIDPTVSQCEIGIPTLLSQRTDGYNTLWTCSTCSTFMRWQPNFTSTYCRINACSA